MYEQEHFIKKVTYFLKQMEVLQHNPDTEAAHSKADDILIEIIGFLACRKDVSEEGYSIIQQAVKTWQELPKWYA